MQTIKESLLYTNTTIRDLEKKYQRPPHSVTLLAIIKGQPLTKVEAAIAAGQRCFGENYLQEALAKIDVLTQPELEWHFTGHIQSNKTRLIAEHFAWAQTVCDKKIAKRLNDQRPLSAPPLNICLEVNLSSESSKAGVIATTELIALAEYCLTLPRLRLRGLMAIPARQPTFTEQRAECRKLYALKQHLCDLGFPLDTLSLGMTADMEAAIAEGATLVRIGQGIFGPRSTLARSPLL